MNTEQIIYDKLTAALSPTSLEVINESHKHAGHHSSPNTGQSHFRITIQSAELDGLGRVAQQRRIYRILADEMAGSVHALGIRVIR